MQVHELIAQYQFLEEESEKLKKFKELLSLIDEDFFTNYVL